MSGRGELFASPSRHVQASTRDHTTPSTPIRHQLQSDGIPTPQEPSIFCHRCLTNQRIHLELLSAYEDETSSSSYASSSSLPVGSYEAYKADLDARYPLLCDRCRPAVESKIKERDDIARRWIWRKWMERGREEETAGQGSQSTGWKAPTGAVRGRGLDYERRRKRRKSQLKMIESSMRWTLIVMGPLHTFSNHLMTSQAHQFSLVLYRTLPSGFPVATLSKYAWPLAGLANCTAVLQSHPQEVDEGDEGAGSGRKPARRSMIRALHCLTYCQIIDTQLGAAWVHCVPASSILQRIPASAFGCVCLALQVVLLLLCILRRPVSPTIMKRPRATDTKQPNECQDVFDSLSQSLSQVTDSISAGSAALQGGEEPGAVFGQTTWASANERTVPSSWRNEQILQPSQARRDEPMELDAPVAPAQVTPMDWQPTPPPENTSMHQHQHRSPPSSPTPASRSSIFGPQKFYVPEEPIGGLEESFSRGLSLGATSEEREDVDMEAALPTSGGMVQGAVLVAMLGLVIGLLTVVWHKSQESPSGYVHVYKTGRVMCSSIARWVESRWLAPANADYAM